MKVKLNLFELNQNSQKNVKAGDVSGGGGCGCGCLYANSGGSSRTDNACANADHGLSTPYPGYPVLLTD
jgi:hypothetical protein